MKQITATDMLSSASRMSTSSSAKAAQVICESEKFIDQKIGKDFCWKIRCWKNGILFIEVEHSAGAQIIYTLNEALLSILQEKFSEYRFQGIRTEIVCQ